MKWIMALGFGLGLSACGVDGEPVKPAIGSTVTVNNSGVSVATRAGVRLGPLTLGVRL